MTIAFFKTKGGNASHYASLYHQMRKILNQTHKMRLKFYQNYIIYHKFMQVVLKFTKTIHLFIENFGK